MTLLWMEGGITSRFPLQTKPSTTCRSCLISGTLKAFKSGSSRWVPRNTYSHNFFVKVHFSAASRTSSSVTAVLLFIAWQHSTSIILFTWCSMSKYKEGMIKHDKGQEHCMKEGDTVIATQQKRNKLTPSYNDKPLKITRVKGSMITATSQSRTLT